MKIKGGCEKLDDVLFRNLDGSLWTVSSRFLFFFNIDTGQKNGKIHMIQHGAVLSLLAVKTFFGAVLGKKQLFDWEPISATCETTMFAEVKLDGR